MNENDQNIEILTNYADEWKRKYLSKDRINSDSIYFIDYEALLKKCKHEEKYIDLNLEINYNLEEMIENKDNIIKYLHLCDTNDDKSSYREKVNKDYIKNNKYYYDNFYFDTKNEISELNYKKENKNIENKNKNLHYEKDHSENNSSYSNDTYCSDIYVDSLENEKIKSMNFSQRITYDNNELIHNLNLYDKIINYSTYDKKCEKNHGINSQIKSEQKENNNCHISYFIKKNNNETYSNSYEKQRKPSQNKRTDNSVHKKEKECCYYLSSESRNNINEYNLDNFSINLNLFKSSNSLNMREIEQEILNIYEKILKVMKYLRKVKTKYHEIETIVSILSNHIKNVTFNCEKMFDSRSQLNDFLKKIYIYQIFLLKKLFI